MTATAPEQVIENVLPKLYYSFHFLWWSHKEKEQEKMIIYIFNFLWQNPEKKDGTMLKFYQRGLIWIVASFTIFTLTIMLLDYP